MKIHIFLAKPKHCVFLHVKFLRNLLDYVWHWLSANSRHGVHSPFVYQLVDEVIYGTQLVEQISLPESLQKQTPKVQAMLGRVLQAHAPSGDFTTLYVVDTPTAHADMLAQAKPDTLLIVPGIYQSAELKNQWKLIQAHSAVTVTIDLFYVGLVYFRKSQAKEDFKIRF
ncbi:MAG: hypothetical protein NT021_06330 [Sphingobacteriales bacterium]|jgi:hypothetical protein|nr:hypothetical protein [Sphingobacteriales bacterium]